MIKIYGVPRSSAGRCYLMLEELGLPYETVPLDMRNKEHKSEAFLKINPNGKVPALIDGDFIIWESVAINHYLAEKHRPELLGKTVADRARQIQWSIWSMTDLQPPLVDLIIQFIFTPEEKRNLHLIEKAREKVPPMLAILDSALAGKTYILGSDISVADFNLASVVNIASSFEFDFSPYKDMSAWLARIKDRPSFKKVAQLRA
ncbi:MAG: glutathione S-transferase family protein [Anaerolineales bacterium]|nr:glutathione S-transferase family protein [Anaerolineales bacterium]